MKHRSLSFSNHFFLFSKGIAQLFVCEVNIVYMIISMQMKLWWRKKFSLHRRKEVFCFFYSLKGLYSDRQYIASQGPLKETSEDFWEMVLQYNVLKVVMLTKTEEKNPHNPSQLLINFLIYFFFLVQMLSLFPW